MSVGNASRKVLPFVVGALLTIVAYNVTFPESNPSIESPIADHLAFIEACKERGEEIDLIIIGSSLAVAGIDTPMLQEIVREKGGREFNALTVGALSFDVQGNNRLLREVLEAGVPGLDVVIMEQSIFPRGYPEPSQERTVPYLWLYADPREALASIDGILRSDASPTEKLSRIRTVLGHFFSGALAFNFVGVFTERMADGASGGDAGEDGDGKERFALTEAMEVARGHARTRDRAPGFTREAWDKYLAHIRKKKREAETSGFNRETSPMILEYPFEMARKHDFDLVLLFTPSALMTEHVEVYRDLSDGFAARGVRSAVWDYNDFSDPETMAYMEYEMRSDQIHLGRGAERFTREVAKRLVHFLDAGGRAADAGLEGSAEPGPTAQGDHEMAVQR